MRWARASIEIGHPGFVLTPIVIGKERVPLIRDDEEARRDPQMAVVGAIAHRQPDVALAAFAALGDMPADMRGVYWEAIVSELSPSKRRALEESMDPSIFGSSRYGQELQAMGRKVGRQEGRQEGLEQGVKEGLEKGLEKGLAKGRAEVALALVVAKLGKVSKRIEAGVRRLAKDERRVRALITQLVSAETEKQARAILTQATR